MSDCCSSHKSASKTSKQSCPACSSESRQVSEVIISYQLKEPWRWLPEDSPYYFCASSHCQVVYFDLNNTRISASELRQPVGLKQRTPQSLVCYCYGVTRQQAQDQPEARAYVTEQTRQKQCACQSHNPSGRCCLSEWA